MKKWKTYCLFLSLLTSCVGMYLYLYLNSLNYWNISQITTNPIPNAANNLTRTVISTRTAHPVYSGDRCCTVTNKYIHQKRGEPEMPVDIENNLSDNISESTDISASYGNYTNTANKIKSTMCCKEYLERLTRHSKNFNCRAILEEDKNETARAASVTKNDLNTTLLAGDYIKMISKNCSHFLSLRGYISRSLSEEEEGFPLAYSILMYKDIEQSERLLRAIYQPQNVYCIHVDKKSSDAIFDALSNISSCFDNVFMSPVRYNVKWATMTVLLPELECMKELYQRFKTWKYFINLTGQEFPLKTNYELVKALRSYNSSNLVESGGKPPRQRYKDAGIPPHNVFVTKGSVHVMVSRGFVRYVLEDKRAKDLLYWVSKTLFPDETYFATLNNNKHLEVPGSNVSVSTQYKLLIRFKPWVFDTRKCPERRVRKICIIRTQDVPVLAQSSGAFANKFHLDYQPAALDCMEEVIFNRTRDECKSRCTANEL